MTDMQKQKEEASVYLNNWKRAQANLENYKKDENKRMGDAVEFAKKMVVEDFLGVMDDLEEALRSAMADERHPNDGHREGIQMTLNKFNRILAGPAYAVERIKTDGERFDPLRHEAVQTVQAEGPPGHVVREVRAGYMMRGRVIRPARVIISK